MDPNSFFTLSQLFNKIFEKKHQSEHGKIGENNFITFYENNHGEMTPCTPRSLDQVKKQNIFLQFKNNNVEDTKFEYRSSSEFTDIQLKKYLEQAKKSSGLD